MVKPKKKNDQNLNKYVLDVLHLRMDGFYYEEDMALLFASHLWNSKNGIH
jgi:hypothetical protein